ncbi:hypothetical protein [Sorangium sp. So ce861]|uniref:hypothetical protein n=1 Tax=Sorangium sp. So ce861 TaxID=3133323 RepID=UPI003F640231
MGIFSKKPTKAKNPQRVPDVPEPPLKRKRSVDTTPIRSRPQIMLVDVAGEATDALREAGYNAISGSFGIIYKIARKDDKYTQVSYSGSLPGYTEKDIIIVDVEGHEGDTPAEKSEDSLTEFWMSCRHGEVDPRPLLMMTARSKLDRILNSGGIFIVFACPRKEVTYNTGSKRGSYIEIQKSHVFSNFDFLSVLAAIETDVDSGSDIRVTAAGQPLASILSRHLSRGSFSCTMSPVRYGPEIPHIAEDWVDLATNRFGAAVAAAITPSGSRNGLVLLFPSVPNRAAFLKDLVDSVLPELAPALFPENEGGQWIFRPEYESPRVVEANKQIETISTEAQRRIDALLLQIEEERARYRFMYELLRGTGKELVAAVKEALETIGFSVVDVDAEKTRLKKTTLDEDLWIQEPNSPLVLVEVKGLNKRVPDAESLQAWKYVAPRMRELKRVDIQALAIINHERGVPPLSRDNDNVFRQEIVDNAEEHEFGLMTAWDLFWIVKNMQANGWLSEWVKPIFYRSGRISRLPEHYEPLGVVERFLNKKGVVSVRVDADDLRNGDRIAFVQPTGAREQQIESMQVDRQQRTQVTKGELVGVKIDASEEEIKVGAQVFRIKRACLGSG